ncbi:MAG: hypothetical protein DRP61_03730 [Candidatus Omnitrophota bacterium]|nr:MAG: hypothetical protein DRP61_03730 [Candidatus Omnitrophota bacterium]RKY43514.1 MAG: hypothetical protein DRP80_04975 [Candidatus Omnitrophota bacterium]
MEELEKDNFLVYKVRGNSMWPFLRDKDTVLVKPSEVGEVSLGEVVLVKKDGVFLCHRVFRKGKDFIQTKADIFFKPDFISKKEEFLGKVVGIIRRGKIIILNTRLNKYLGFLMLGFSFILSLLYLILKVFKRVKWKTI